MRPNPTRRFSVPTEDDVIALFHKDLQPRLAAAVKEARKAKNLRVPLGAQPNPPAHANAVAAKSSFNAKKLDLVDETIKLVVLATGKSSPKLAPLTKPRGGISPRKAPIYPALPVLKVPSSKSLQKLAVTPPKVKFTPRFKNQQKKLNRAQAMASSAALAAAGILPRTPTNHAVIYGGNGEDRRVSIDSIPGDGIKGMDIFLTPPTNIVVKGLATIDDVSDDEAKAAPRAKVLPATAIVNATGPAKKTINDKRPTLATSRSERRHGHRRMPSVIAISREGSPISHKSGPQGWMMVDDDYSPRSRNGVGATVSVSKDAHSVIMGDDEGYTGGVGQLPEGSYRLSSLKSVKSVNHLYPPRTSSLPGTPDDATGASAKASAQSVFDRLSRPTKSSARRESDSKATMLRRPVRAVSFPSSIRTASGSSTASGSTDVPKSGTINNLKKKGFRSTISSFISAGRRPSEAVTTESVPPLTQEELAKIDYHNQLSGLGTYSAKGKSVVKGKTAEKENIIEKKKPVAKTGRRSDPSQAYKKPQTDRAANDKNARDRAAAAAFIESDHARTSPGTYPGRAPAEYPHHGLGRRRDDDEDPNTPPPSRDGASGHYAEGVARAAANNDDHEAMLTDMIRRANQALHQLVRMAESITDAEHRRLLSELITHLTACLRATNIAREAQHLVVRATERLDLYTISVSAQAVAAVANASGGAH